MENKKEEFMKKVRDIIKSKDMKFDHIYIRLIDNTVLYVTRIRESSLNENHILVYNKQLIGHIPIKSVKEVF